MSNDFDINYGHCNCCKRYEFIHFGKLSSGWCFQAHEHLDINSWKDWKKWIKENNGFITDEYNKVYSIEEMESILILKHTYNHLQHDRYYVDKEGYLFCNQEFS